jgi:hypothetical protein
MDKIEQINFYTVKRDLSVVKHTSIEDCIQEDDFSYCIKETRGVWHDPAQKKTFSSPDLEIQLSGKNNEPFFIVENGWKVLSIKIKASAKGWGTARTLITMDIADSLGNVQHRCADIEYYEGIIQLHRLLKYTSKSPSWEIANERKNRVDLKKIFIRLKNGHCIHRSLYINPDEEYSVNLSFKNGIYIMNSCIIEGVLYIDGVYKNEEQYENEDFYCFMNTVQKRFPAINFNL